MMLCVWITVITQKHPFLDDFDLMYIYHPELDDYRRSIIIHFWKLTIPAEEGNLGDCRDGVAAAGGSAEAGEGACHEA